MPGLPPSPAAGGPSPSPLLSPSALEMWDSLEAVVYVADMRTHEVLFANREACAALGGNPVGRLCWQAFQSGQTGPCAFCTNSRLVDARGEPAGPLRWEFQNTRNGRWYAIVDQALRWRDGRLARLEIATDITVVKERKAAQEEVHNRLKRILEHSGDAYFLADAQGSILDANLAAERSLGYGRDELLRLKVTDIEVGFPGLDNAEVARSLPLDQTTTLEGAHRRKDGSVFPVELSLCPFMEEGRLLILALARDISARRREEQVLRESEELYRSLFTEAMDILVVADPETGRIVDCNRAALTAFGYVREEMLGLRQQDLHPESWRANGFSREFREHATTRLGEVIEAPIVTKAGEQRVALIKTGLFPAGGRNYTLGVFADITERRRHEEELREKEARFRALFNATSDSVLLLAPDGTVLDLNENAARRRDMDPVAMRGRKIYAFLPAAAADRRRKAVDRVLAEGRLEQHEEVRDGRHYRIRIFPVFDHAGRVFQLASFSRDVTEQTLAEKGLKESEERNRLIVETAREGVWAMDAQFRTTFVNRSMARMLGYSESEMLGRPATSFMFGEDLRAHGAQMQSRQKGMDGQYERRFRRKDGRELWTLASATALKDAAGRFCGSFAMYTDITERKRDEEALAQYRLALESAEDMVAVLDGRHCYTMVNEAYLRMAGLARDKVLGRSVRAVLGPETCAAVRPRLDAALAGTPARFTMQRDTPSGPRMLQASYFPVPLAGHEPLVAAVIRDITEQSAHEAALLAAKEAAEAASRAKSEFLATMSHEIRTPLNGVMGMLQLLQCADLEEEERGYAEVALESSRSLLRILSDILDMSRIEAGTMEIAAEEFSPAEAVEPVFVAFRDEAARKGLGYSRVLGPGLPERVVADPVRIRQVLFNLVGNAVKYTQAGEVRLEAYPLPHPRDPGGLMLHCVVADTGMGIPDEKLTQMFEPFTQLDGSSTRQFGGAGLGLAIVKRLIRLMGGTLAVDSEPGRGTEMHFSLPVRAAGAAAAAEGLAAGRAAAAEPPAAARGLRVLVVEDDRSNLVAALHMLRRLGHEPEGAGEGGEALEMLRQGSFDCVLMDIQMPGLDGVAATRRIRNGEAGEAARSVPIIALTAHAMAGDRESFLAAGMDGYLAKPMDMDELQAILARSTGQTPGTWEA